MTTTTINPDRIYPTEPVRYPERERWSFNNGFRLRWLASGRRTAEVVNAARRGDAAAVEAYAGMIGGLRCVKAFVRSAIAAARHLPADLSAYRIDERMVYTPHLTWKFEGRRQVAVIEWWPMFGPGR